MNRASPCAFEPGCWCEARKRPTGSGGTAFYVVVARRDAGSYGRKGSDHSTVDEYAFGAAVLALAERALRWNADFLGRRGVAWAAFTTWDICSANKFPGRSVPGFRQDLGNIAMSRWNPTIAADDGRSEILSHRHRRSGFPECPVIRQHGRLILD